ncbi:MAG: phosphate/phosphite/phosphonate ABC transporter substrate-binding protein [Halobacteria archaeon]|nr:phosphate/phosphite/phosphonate ABC transporter substrate-binding protein [Halobacteria archaeon]
MAKRLIGFTCYLLLALLPASALVAQPETQAPGSSPRGDGTTASITADTDRVYTFGVVPQFEQRKLFRTWRPLLNELQRRTGLKFRLVGTPKIPAFEKQFLAGDFDFAYMNPYHVIQAHDSQGYVPLVRDGGRTLNGVIVVPKDSPVTSPGELKDKELAFPSANALGASMLIRADLHNRFKVNVNSRYVQTHSSVYLHVANKLVAGGGGVQSTLNSQAPSIKDAVRVIYKTVGIPPHPVAAHPRVPAAHRKSVQLAFLDIAATEEGASMLAQIPVVGLVASSIEDYGIIETLNLKAFYVSD